MKQFKIHLVNSSHEKYFQDEHGIHQKALLKDEKDVVITAEYACEACSHAIKMNPTYIFTSVEELKS